MRSGLRRNDLRAFYSTLPRFPLRWPAKAKHPKDAASRARTLVREQLADGPKPGSQIKAAAQAAEVPEPELIKRLPRSACARATDSGWFPG